MTANLEVLTAPFANCHPLWYTCQFGTLSLSRRVLKCFYAITRTAGATLASPFTLERCAAHRALSAVKFVFGAIVLLAATITPTQRATAPRLVAKHNPFGPYNRCVGLFLALGCAVCWARSTASRSHDIASAYWANPCATITITHGLTSVGHGLGCYQQRGAICRLGTHKTSITCGPVGGGLPRPASLSVRDPGTLTPRATRTLHLQRPVLAPTSSNRHDMVRNEPDPDLPTVRAPCRPRPVSELEPVLGQERIDHCLAPTPLLGRVEVRSL